MKLKLVEDFSNFNSWEDINKVLKRNAHEAGFKPGKYVINSNGKASIIKELLTGTFAINVKQDCALAYLDKLYQDYVPIKNLTIISKEEYLGNPMYRFQRENQKLRWKISNLERERNRYKNAFETLLKNGKLDTTCCHYGPCEKSNLGLCDSECDYPGA